MINQGHFFSLQSAMHIYGITGIMKLAAGRIELKLRKDLKLCLNSNK